MRRTILALALLFGALAVAQGPSQAAPLGASAQAAPASGLTADKAHYYRRAYYRPAYFYRPRYYRPAYFYRPRFYRPRYYRPAYFYRPRYYRPAYVYRPRARFYY